MTNRNALPALFWILPALCLALSFGGPVRPASATQTENHGLHAVPAPGRVSIDGSYVRALQGGA